MRFRNLTIMITLGFLSIVAFIGLALLPIADVISCTNSDADPDNDVEWNKSYDNTRANFLAYHKYDGDDDAARRDHNNMGWGVSASLEVSVNDHGYGVSSASASPYIVDPDRMRKLWEQDNTVTSISYYGNAVAKAAVFPFYFNHKYGDQAQYIDDSSSGGYTSLSVAAVMVPTTYRNIYLTSETDSRTDTVKVEVEAGVSTSEFVSLIAELSVTATGSYEYKDTNQKVWSATIGKERTESIFQQGQTTEKSAYFVGDSSSGSAWASISNFRMEACCFDSERVELSFGSSNN